MTRQKLNQRVAGHQRNHDGSEVAARPKGFGPLLDAILILLFATFFGSFQWARFRESRG